MFLQGLSKIISPEYQSLKKIYRNLIKGKKENFKQDQIAKLVKACDDKNLMEFWRLLKTEIKLPSINITQNEWFEYFSNLFNDPDNLNNDNTFHDEIGANNKTLAFTYYCLRNTSLNNVFKE